MITFEEKSGDDSILDEWMNKAFSSTSQVNTQSHNITTSLSSSINNSKTGLGFETNKNKKSTDKISLSSDPLAKVLSKQQKKKQKRALDQIAANHERRDLHGMIETDIFEESRTQIIRSVGVTQVVRSLSKGEEDQQKKKKQKKNDTTTTTADPSPTKEDSNQSLEEHPVMQQVNTEISRVSADSGRNGINQKQKDNNRKAHVTDFITSIEKQSDSAFQQNMVTGQEQEKSLGKKKRKKTRSKQKNIRRDTRSNEEKPSYLRLDSEIYRGHELTAETKKRLGIADL